MLKGIFPPIPTPFEDGELALDHLENNIKKWNKTAISGYVVFGSNGESVYLTREEKLKAIEKVKESAENKTIIAGTGSDSIKETIYLTNEAAVHGAQYALILTPSFYQGKMNHEAFISYFKHVADESRIPIIIYNVPKFTNVSISAETVAELSEHENIIGIKHSSENTAQFSEIINKTPEGFSCLVGTASILFSGLLLGGTGGILALANIAPDKCVQLLELIETGDIAEARVLQMQLLEVNKAVTASYGIAGLKYALDELGYFGGIPRAPLSPLSEKEKKDLKEILIKSEIL